MRFTGRDDGDLGHGGRTVEVADPDVEARRRAVVDLPWTWIRQVHGADVVVVTEPGGGAGRSGDGAVTDRPRCALSVLTADCAPVILVGDEPILGVAHAGWRGVHSGVLAAAADAMRSMGATGIRALVGPCIHAECYAFGEGPLADMSDRFGGAVRGETTDGRPALDLPAAVAVALSDAGVDNVDWASPCTACTPGYFSWRARTERERQAAVAWL